MKSKIFILFFPLLMDLLFSVFPLPASAQSQAINGQIEGTILDQNNAAVPNALITATNTQTGASRTTQTDQSGVYRFPLLPLGTYRLSAEAANFKKALHERIILTTGQTVTVNLSLEAGNVREIITVSTDSPLIDVGKTDLGRVMDAREVKNLPLISRNPYNFALLQANVSGRPSPGNPFPTVNANGYARRVNYLLDGNTNTQADRAGVRLVIISETLVSEIQLVANGFAPEFGNTPGLIMNIVTPSGTNNFRGTVSYRFARTPFFSRPFFYNSPEALPENNFDNFTAAASGPVIKDRWHFFAGYEWSDRDDKIGRLVTIQTAHQAQLVAAGLPASIFPPVIPSSNKSDYYIFRADGEINQNNRLTGRFIHSSIYSKNFSPAGGLNTLERAADSKSVSHSLGIQLVSFIPELLNELRFQFARRKTSSLRNEFSGMGPSIVISNVANFGAPDNAGTVNPLEKVTQIQNNLTWTRGTHVIKLGGGFNFIDDFKRQAVFARYIFPSISAYLAARNRTDPRSYSTYVEAFGNPEIKYQSTYWNFFIQDDWKLNRRLKINYGLRYDLYVIPEADKTSPFPDSQEFNLDKNNFAPRLGIVFTLREGKRPTVFRAGAGIYYETPWLNMYERALLRNGNPRFVNLTFIGNNNGTRASIPPAPAFPSTFSGSFPAGSVLPPQDIDTVAPDFENMYAIHTNIQLEQAVTENLSLAIGFTHSGGRRIPIYRNINCLPVGGTLADGRPLYGAISGTGIVTPCAKRLFPQFRHIQMVVSDGVSRYDALTLQLARRHSGRVQLSVGYTLSKATDDAPEQNLSTGALQNLMLTDPNNRRLDRGRSFADQRHTFVMSMVASPKFNFGNK